MRNKHTYIQKRLLLYLDEELEPTEQKLVQEHLRHCHDCKHLAEQMAALYQPAPSAPPAMSPFLWTRISNRLQEASPVHRRKIWRPVLVTAIALLCIWVGHLLGSFQTTAGSMNQEEMLYQSFGMNEMEPFAYYSMAGAVHAVYEGQ